MKSGNPFTIQVESQFSYDDYQNAHTDFSCSGSWSIKVCHHTPFNVDGLGIIQVPLIPFIVCSTCQASYVMPGFEEFLDKTLVFQLIANKKILASNQIRFLRLAFDLTQEDVAQFLKIERTYYSKTESLKGTVTLSPDKQVRLKLFYAQKLGIKDSALLYNMIQIDNAFEPPRIHIDESDFESSLKEALHLDEKLLAGA